MPKGRKKKELPPLESNLKETNVVQKSKPLFSLWKSELNLSEFKILDTYLSRINSHKPEQRSIVFEKGELEKLLGVKKINREDLDTRLKHLGSTTVDISNGKSIDRITLFERAQGTQDEYGLWQISLTCTPSAMRYIFNIEKLGYLRYQIRSITQISSLYSYILFTYIEYNRIRKSWKVSLNELKDILNCNDESYSEFKIFNNRILKRCQKELTEKTSQRFEYETIKSGRKVTGIKFTVATLSDELVAGSKPLALGTMGEDGEFVGQTTLFDEQEQEQDELTALLGKDFDNADIDYIRQIIADSSCDMSLVRTAHAKYMLYKSKGKIKNPKGDRGYFTKILGQLIADTKKQEQRKPSYDLDKRHELALTFDPNTISFDDTEGM